MHKHNRRRFFSSEFFNFICPNKKSLRSPLSTMKILIDDLSTFDAGEGSRVARF
jgi:hypothetical protein